MKATLFRVFTFLFTLVVVAGCSKDADEAAPTLPVRDDMMVTFRMKVPGAAAPSSRAISDADETTITEIDILVFKVNGNQETFTYRTQATDINNNGGATAKEFNAVLRVGTDRYRIVILANLRSAVNNAGGFTSLMTKQEVLERIKFNSSSNWNTTSSANFKPLPMWGETSGTHEINETTNGSTFGVIKLVRAVARIDVGVKMNASGVPQGLGDLFKISDIVVYNSQKQGYAAPDPANMTGMMTAQYPTVPAGQLNSTPLRYNYSPATIGTVREIYLAESENATQTADDQVTCLVVGGYYTAPSAGTPNTTVKTWYRIDFYDRSSATPANTRLDILRNHLYRVNITTVDGPGYPNEEEAYNSAPINLGADVIPWDEGAMSDVTSDGTYQLVVDRDSLHFYSEGRAQTMRIYTDVPTGWEVKAEDKPAWLTITRDPLTTDVTLTAVRWPTPNVPRQAYFTITAGRIKKKIKVYQISETELTLEVYPEQLTFYRNALEPKSFTVNTYPANVARRFNTVGTITNWLAGYNPNNFNNTTNTEYSVRPGINNSGTTRSSILTVYVQQGGTLVSKAINIRHLPHNMRFSYIAENPYPAEGGTFDIRTLSDAPWHTLTKSDPNNAVTQWPQSLFPEGDNDYTFTLEPFHSYALERQISFNVTSPDPDFPSTTIRITQTGNPPYMRWVEAASMGQTPGETPGVSTTYRGKNVSSIDAGTTAQTWANNITFIPRMYRNSTIDHFNKVFEYMNLDGAPIVFGQTYQGGAIFDERRHVLDFKYKSYPFYHGYPAAGSILGSFTLRFESLGTSESYYSSISYGISANSFLGTDINSNNTIPPIYLDGSSLPAANSAISKGAHTVSFRPYTNASIVLRVTINGSQDVVTSSVTPSPLDYKDISLQIPENTTGVDRTMNIQYRYDTVVGSETSYLWYNVTTLTQSGT